MPSLPLPKGKPIDVPRTVHQALELHHQGRIAEAEQLYATVLAVRPDNIDALQMLGVIKLARGELVTALRLVAAAMQLRPKSPQILLNYGLVLNAMNRPEEALASFDEALKQFEGAAGPMDKLASLYPANRTYQKESATVLAWVGDAQRSRNIFVDALQMSQQAAVTKVSFVRSDYGSSLRDGAAVLALAAESRPVPPIIPELAGVVAKEWQNKTYTSTQEQTWMLLAARALQNGDDGLTLDVNGATHTGAYMAQMTGDALIGHPLTVTNTTRQPLSAAVTTVAAPVTPLPAGGDGFTIERKYYTLDGEEANITQAQQNERYVVVLHVTETNDWPSRILVTDLLPAGFEIDNPSIVNSAQLSNFDWLSDVQPAHVEFRNDRFVAAFDQSSGSDRDLSFAYVVRAVTPGTYDHPAASVEDMYRPQFSARTAMGRMEVLAAQQ